MSSAKRQFSVIGLAIIGVHSIRIESRLCITETQTSVHTQSHGPEQTSGAHSKIPSHHLILPEPISCISRGHI